MIKAFIVVFLGMFVYGAFTGMWGPGLIALFCAGFMLWAGKRLDKQDREWATDPRRARVLEVDTLTRLESEGCECMCCYSDPRFSTQTSKSDLEI